MNLFWGKHSNFFTLPQKERPVQERRGEELQQVTHRMTGKKTQYSLVSSLRRLIFSSKLWISLQSSVISPKLVRDDEWVCSLKEGWWWLHREESTSDFEDTTIYLSSRRAWKERKLHLHVHLNLNIFLKDFTTGSDIGNGSGSNWKREP